MEKVTSRAENCSARASSARTHHYWSPTCARGRVQGQDHSLDKEQISIFRSKIVKIRPFSPFFWIRTGWLPICSSIPYFLFFKLNFARVVLVVLGISFHVLFFRIFAWLLNDGAKRNRLLYLKIMYTAIRKILCLQVFL